MSNRVLTVFSIGAFAVLLGSCGSVASRATDGGAGGSIGAGDATSGGGGSPGTDGGAGGASGTGGARAGSDGGVISDAGIRARGGVTPLGRSSATGSIRVQRQRLSANQVCGANICVSGGLVP
jgi:hypothetical protein